MIEAPQAARHIAFCFFCWPAPPVATLRANMFMPSTCRRAKKCYDRTRGCARPVRKWP